MIEKGYEVEMAEWYFSLFGSYDRFSQKRKILVCGYGIDLSLTEYFLKIAKDEVVITYSIYY
jgi:hypothetical protein